MFTGFCKAFDAWQLREESGLALALLPKPLIADQYAVGLGELLAFRDQTSDQLRADTGGVTKGEGNDRACCGHVISSLVRVGVVVGFFNQFAFYGLLVGLPDQLR